MALSIKSDEADALAREIARLTGESLTDTVTVALRQRLDRENRIRGRDLHDVVAELQARVAQMPVLDDRPIDDLLYDEHGLPG
ncbi:MAG TPA: type II toxin-antitoxin system VapB family antitoxin [Iamia sp.]|nr:type II toxin-antitoxin system VapB family antitoxin [Iamia sp.]